MKHNTLRTFMFAFLFLAVAGTVQSYAARAEEPETVVVTDKTSDEKVADAQHKIAQIQSDPGYYYSGAWGATNRVNDVREQMAIIHNAQRFPASVH
jgi:hypothetical protein